MKTGLTKEASSLPPGKLDAHTGLVRRRDDGGASPSAAPVRLTLPFSGHWLVQNSPANRVPSHGTHLFATAFAIDFVPVDERGRSAPITARTWMSTEAPELFTGFGRTIIAPIGGRVVVAHDGEVDHAAFRGPRSLLYAATQARRVTAGWPALAGNHVIIQADAGVFVALCHLRRSSVSVQAGSTVRPGDLLGQCGNSGNSTEPHVHLQAMDTPDPGVARPLPIEFADGLPRNGDIVTGADAAGRP